MNSETLIGYRKLSALALGLFTTWLISKGMSQELATTLQGVLIELLPTILSFIYMFFNTKTKVLSAPSQKITTAAQAAPVAASPPIPPASSKKLKISL